MTRICPECLTINRDTVNCVTCGFPFDKKIIGKFEDHIFYDSLELANLGHLQAARQKIEDYLLKGSDRKLEALLIKIENIEKQIELANSLADSAIEKLQNHDIDGAANDIKAASELHKDGRIESISARIESALIDQNKIRSAKALLKQGLDQISSGDKMAGIKKLRKASSILPKDKEITDALTNETASWISEVVEDVKGQIATRQYNLASSVLLEAYPLSNGDEQLGSLQGALFTMQQNARKKQTLIKTIAIISGIVLMSFIVYYLINKGSEKTNWEAALKEGSIRSLSIFIEKNPNSDFVNNAREKLNELNEKDSILWFQAMQQGSRQALIRYIDEMSILGGIHLSEARSTLDSLDWFSIQKREDPGSIQEYISNHPDGLYVADARRLLAMQPDENEMQQLLQYVSDYFETFANRDLDRVMLFFNPITPVFGPKRNITKADLRLLMEKDLASTADSRYIIDQSSFKAKRKDDGNIELNFISDTYITRNYETQDNLSTEITIIPTNYFSNIQWELIIDPDWKIISYKYKIISEQKLNQ